MNSPDTITLFTGYDAREAVGWHAFVQSVIEKTSLPVSIIPLGSKMAERDGTAAFTYSRFLVPWICGFRGRAIFVDGADMLMLGDLAELWTRKDEFGSAVSVVKHRYRTKYKRKYLGTEMEADNFAYPRKNWSSVILWECGNYMNRCLTPEYIAKHGGDHLHRFAWLPNDRIGELPPEWNALVGEDEDVGSAKIAHFTLGIPGFQRYRDCAHSGEWRAAMSRAQRGLQTHVLTER